MTHQMWLRKLSRTESWCAVLTDVLRKVVYRPRSTQPICNWTFCTWVFRIYMRTCTAFDAVLHTDGCIFMTTHLLWDTRFITSASCRTLFTAWGVFDITFWRWVHDYLQTDHYCCCRFHGLGPLVCFDSENFWNYGSFHGFI